MIVFLRYIFTPKYRKVNNISSTHYINRAGFDNNINSQYVILITIDRITVNPSVSCQEYEGSVLL